MNTQNNTPTIFDLFSSPLKNFDLIKSPEELKCDLKNLDDAYELSVDLPGVKKEEISLSFENQVLTISAKHHGDFDKDSGDFILHERTSGVYNRSIMLNDVDPEGIEAKFENGILSVKLKKQAKSITRAIKIN